MIKVKCPCCGYYTQLVETSDEPLFEICEVCFWQYDAVAHDNPNMVIGANHISLYDAQENYKKFGACKEKFKNDVRKPFLEELPEKNEEQFYKYAYKPNK